MNHKFKYLIALFSILLINVAAWACPVCEDQQPAITKGWTHGTGPQSNMDWVIIAVISLIALLTLVFSLKYLIKPGEKSKKHIKVSILNFE